MPFANDDGRPLGLLVLMRLVSANSFPFRYKGVRDEHSDFAIHPLGSRRRQGMFAYVPAHKARYVALAATTGTRRFTVNSGTLPPQEKK
jgi:hypothetical protein